MHTTTYIYLAIALIITGWVPRVARGHSTPMPPISKVEAMKLLLVTPKPSPVSAAIVKVQMALKEKRADMKHLEKLGQLFITEARVLHDEASYQLADLCGRVMELEVPELPEALLLRGNALLAMHRFHDAEEVALRLLMRRQDMMDQALLGDALMEQGRLEESLPVYQAMIDAKPCLPSYSRVAHVRWLRGDVMGAIEIMEQAVSCGSYRDPEPMAWCSSRLAFYHAQNGDSNAALQMAERALQLVPDYPQALFVMGRVKLARGELSAAVESLQKAATRTPLPEILWALSEAQIASHEETKAAATNILIKQTGAAADPRSFALYLATQRIDTEQALELAKAELRLRQDVFSWDALAWTQYAAGETEAAMISVRRAMAEGTRDARMFLHAGIIAKASGDAQSGQWLEQADTMRALLLPVEQAFLDHSNSAAASQTRSNQPQMVTKQNKHPTK